LKILHITKLKSGGAYIACTHFCKALSMLDHQNEIKLIDEDYNLDEYGAIFLHWFGVGYPTLNTNRRVFIVLHDYSSITGGCVYRKGCYKNLDGCNNCPQKIKDSHKILKSRPNYKRIACGQKIFVDSLNSGFETEYVHISVGDSQPFEKYEDEVFLWVSEYPTERKGSMDIIGLSNNYKINVVGRYDKVLSLHDNINTFGYTPNEYMFEFYKKCYAVLIPSSEETCGLVALEAMKYGRPVLGYNSIYPMLTIHKENLRESINELKENYDYHRDLAIKMYKTRTYKKMSEDLERILWT
jgi:glycosyltransferase involved in cell wall biosynthesis